MGQRLCLVCHAENMREWRKTHRLTPEQRQKDNARSHANQYQRRGKLKPEPCLRCGSPWPEKHHPDYSRPLEVVWLCRPCHLKEHRGVFHEISQTTQ